MKTRRILALLMILGVTVLATQVLLLGCAKQSSPHPEPTPSIMVAEAIPEQSMQSSYATAKSLEELVALSTVIVIGKMYGIGETFNTARDVNDITKPDPNLLVLGQVYHIAVERYLKGSGGNTLSVVQAEAYLTNRMPWTQENINKARAKDDHIPLRSGIKYLFFFRRSQGFPGEDYFAGTLHPWRFTLPDAGNAEPESPWHLAKQVFPSRPSASLISEVEQLVSRAKITPTVTKVPATPTARPYP